MLNILPAQKKSQIQKEQLYNTIRSASLLVIGFFLLADIGFFGARALVEQWHNQLNAEQTSITVSAEDQTSIETDLDNLTATMSAITEIQADHHNPVSIIVPVLKAFPEGTTVEEITIDVDSQQIVANGFTRDRDSFVILQEQLNATPILTDVNFEVTSFTKKENIPFEFNAVINYENLEIN